MTQLIDDSSSSDLPLTPLALYLALARGVFIPHAIWMSARFRNKFFLRALLMPVLTYRLLKMVTQHPACDSLLLAQPRIPCRIHRPYLSNQVSRREGVAAIIHHYTTLTALLGTVRFRQHISASGLTIATVSGKDNRLYMLRFLSAHTLDREGEASIILKDSDGQMLSEMTFTLCRREGEDALIVGGLQGPNTSDAQHRVHQATKNVHGLFPKRLVLEALLSVAQRLNVRAVYAVANTSHVYRSLRYANRKKHMHADYDSFWEMSGGARRPDGYFQLPLEIKRKSPEDIASKKRSEYRRRFDVLDEIDRQVQATFSAIKVHALNGSDRF